ncbi:MAG: recombinase family protein [Alphaproteobacteria bacterium]|nr:recombinase family protein [Acetobacter sp.]
MFKEFSIGTYNLEQITRKAADFGLKMKTSKKLHKQTIRGILSNRFYVGEMYSGGQYYPHCYPRLTDERGKWG